jgi:hypothetical protein
LTSEEEKFSTIISSLRIPQSQLHHAFFGFKILFHMLKISRFYSNQQKSASSIWGKDNYSWNKYLFESWSFSWNHTISWNYDYYLGTTYQFIMYPLVSASPHIFGFKIRVCILKISMFCQTGKRALPKYEEKLSIIETHIT